jgi:hypothetical protein
MGKIALFGDVGGHLDAYIEGLEAVGVDVLNRVVPDGLCVIQVGDLIHKGPCSNEVVALADDLLRHNDGRYIQLIGNHEAQYLGGPGFWVDDTITDLTVNTLQAWWFDDQLAHAAVAIDTDGGMLVSHAGCTQERWAGPCGREADIAALAAGLDAAARERPWWGLDSGVMLADGTGAWTRPDRASVVWAEPVRELHPGWQKHGTSFGQVHGHASVVSWHRSGQPRRGSPANEDQRTVIDTTNRRTATTITGHTIWGIDPGWGKAAPPKAQPALVRDGHVLAHDGPVPVYPLGWDG